MIAWLAAWWGRKFPPTVASIYQREWAERRRERQHAYFVVDPLSLFSHGIDKPL